MYLSIRDAALGIVMTLVASIAVIGTLIVLAAIAGPADARGGGGAGTGGGGGGDVETDGYVFPLPSKHTYGDGFGAGRGHDGQDVFAKCGRKLVATHDAKVQMVDSDSGYGNFVVLDIKGTDVDHMYAHLKSKADVKEGDKVVAGQKVGEVGDTGNAVGCHLHFEMHTAPGFWEGGKAMRKVTKYLKAWDKYS